MTEITAHHGLLKDTNLHVDDTGGTGRPVVLIHGWPLSGESWSKQVPAFEAAGFRVITYDRRGFGRSDKPLTGYDYDTFASDLDAVLTALDLVDVTLVGFSMGGGEIARYIGTRGEARLHSVVFASAVPPYLEKTDDNPDGPLTKDAAAEMTAGLTKDEDSFYDEFTTGFYSANGVLKVTEAERQEAIALAHQSKKHAALASMAAFATTDFRDDLTKVTVPTLVIHGDSDATVPFEGSGARTHQAIAGSELHVVKDAPHGVTVSHPEEWNQAVLEFLKK
ncbi:alpha/beta fold hydrolase [Clavibacter michiganensis]|jgi:pimeloyl-ACP methyl ester carboxylesterase|uniref:Alpha/beta hydrolase n=1 Tax=Clavibacter michiganensis subsp. insidiosus TaxID=33014 RepID=A0A0D5CIX1_9MICO|nr:alpha/beta hydrolase [Clavibacter michiganensis]AJW79240.1 bromoperoxidase [Clavibacter michiganensis subsp. insidiosus]AWF98038.1 bromoperoxidase [Clavibacter michiganensis subsp. insidiosus]AWG01762.1 bromoperoxidase [Clavibacter michiganensis subsp. insidiosus]OQJ59724.1 alpha/beta hydrolase [Clavibacter michiganensis subsp. insidiosus]RII87184.1 alpha/beta hydrolase [Clavibacter michiganensis subsp. insidiosus]